MAIPPGTVFDPVASAGETEPQFGKRKSQMRKQQKRNLQPRDAGRADAHLTSRHQPLPLPRQNKIEGGYSFGFYLSHLDQQVGPE